MLAEPEVLEDIDCFLPKRSATEKIARFFAIFADPSRVRLLSALALHPLCVTDIADVLELNQTTVSHQLRLLKDNGLVKCERKGKLLYYSIANSKINDVLLVGVESVEL